MLLRFGDLKRYGVNNWPTLQRWIEKQGFPAGIYLGPNTRAWDQSECDAWLASRPKAVPPPEIRKPGPSVAAEETGPLDALAGNQSNSPHRMNRPARQAASDGGA
jgi:hypothetical protein